MTKKVVIPWELKADLAMKAWASNHRGFLYAIREKYGAATALDIFEKVQKMSDRVKNLANAIRTIFKLEGNDAETIGHVLDIWDEITGTEYTTLEWSQTINRRKVTKCPFKTGYKDVSDWSLHFFNIIGKTINPEATLKRPKGMCAGDSYCEYVFKINESLQPKGAMEPMAKKLTIPWELKHDFAMKGWASTHRGHLYALREIYGAAAALEMYDRFCKMGDRVKNLTNALRTIFKLEGNDCETMAKWWDVWWELTGVEYTWLEVTETYNRSKITKCPWKTDPKDISDWVVSFVNIVNKTINSKATSERVKGMCEGDHYCEYVTKIEE